MKLDKAIEVLEEILAYVRPGDPPEEHDATRLGIQALKRIKKGRANLKWPFCDRPLPGETDD